MFSKFTLYKIDANVPANLADYLSRSEFVPTTPNQEQADGWVPPRAAHGAFVESVGGQLIARLMIETRKVPGDALQRHVDQFVNEIERKTGRKPGRKELREIKEQATAELLPQAFPKQASVDVWIDLAAGLLVIGSTSDSQVDLVITRLVRSVPDFSVSPLVTTTTPRAAMAAWLKSLHDGTLHSEAFDVGQECELRADVESKAVVRYKNEDLARADVLQHLQQGKAPTLLGLQFTGSDCRVAFVLTDALKFKAVEVVGVKTDEAAAGDVDAFDADVAIATGELSRMIAALIEELGGLHEPEVAKEAA